MNEKLVMLKNTLSMISTKGNDTIIMADCLRFLDGIIEESKAKVEEVKAEE